MPSLMGTSWKEKAISVTLPVSSFKSLKMNVLQYTILNKYFGADDANFIISEENIIIFEISQILFGERYCQDSQIKFDLFQRFSTFNSLLEKKYVFPVLYYQV